MKEGFVLVLTRYPSVGASSRQRFLQYLPLLQSHGFRFDVRPFFSNRDLMVRYAGSKPFLGTVRAYAARLRAVAGKRRYAAAWVEKDIFPWLPSVPRWSLGGLPYVVDYDDAVFHQYDLHRNSAVRLLLGRVHDKVMRSARTVVVGNEYLGARATAAGARRVVEIPTVVDVARYQPRFGGPGTEPVIGWIGSPSTQHYIEELIPVLARVAERLPFSLRLIGARPFPTGTLRAEFQAWSEEGEAESLAGIDVGVMPLRDTPWERGKCGYKLIQYMAAGKPSIGAAVGANNSIIQHGRTGFLTSSPSEWEAALLRLLQDPALRRQFGENARRAAEERYSLHAQVPLIADLLRDAAGSET